MKYDTRDAASPSVQCLQWTVLLQARGRAVAGAMADEQALSTVCSSIMAPGRRDHGMTRATYNP